MQKLTPKLVRKAYVATNCNKTIKASGSASLTKTPSRSTPDLLNAALNKNNATTPTKLRTPKFNPKATTLNSCFTPSSLYARTKTPTSLKINVRAVKTPRHASGNEDEQQQAEMSNLQVAVRVRPLNAQECLRSSLRNVVHVQGNELTVHVGNSADASAGVTHTFNYDFVFNSADPENAQFATQHRVFLGTAQPLIDRAMQGYNACLFAYGPTGSGKSYSMMGVEELEIEALDGSAPQAETGIIPRFCYELFKRIEDVRDKVEVEVEISYFEIYNEKIHDLLCVEHMEGATQMHCSGKSALKVREHPMWGPYVVDLSVHTVNSYKALRNWIAVGNAQRATAATSMNDKSSRSHAIFNIVLVLTDLDGEATSDSTDSLRQTKRSKISLVDLAGSERISVSGNSGERMREGVSINKSLLTLGKVIAALSDSKRTVNTHVPYRDSTLTWLLRENLGGNSRTVMLATISPANLHIDDTLATLRYASQARSIVNRVKVNESPHDKIIRELRAEVERLKSLRNDYERQKRLSAGQNQTLTPRKIIIETTTVDETAVEALRQQLAEREKELQRAEICWMQRLKELESRRKSDNNILRKKGLAMELAAEQKHACLVNLTADPVDSGTLFYMLPIGVVKVGRKRITEYASQPDIELEGASVAYYHCEIVNAQQKLFIEPLNTKYETLLNGELVTEKRQMFHGDRLVIGDVHFFRISNPHCSKKNEQQLVDYQFAYEEILQKQEQKLRLKLEAEQRAALDKIEREREQHERNFNQRMQQLEQLECKYKNEHQMYETERRAMEEVVASASAAAAAAAVVAATAAESPPQRMQPQKEENDPFAEMNRILLHPTEKRVQQTIAWVKEANEFCRHLNSSLEFEMSEKVDEFGLTVLVVIIWDRLHRRKAKWPVARLHIWLNMLRAENKITADNMFDGMRLDWLPFDANDRRKFYAATTTPTPTPTPTRSMRRAETATQCSLESRRQLKMSERKNRLNGNDTETADLNLLNFGALMKNSLQSLPSLFSPRQNHSPKKINISPYRTTPTRRLLNFEMQDVKTLTKTDTMDSKIQTTDFYSNAAAKVQQMQHTLVQLRRLYEQAAENRENVPIDSAVESTLKEGMRNMDGILHNMLVGLQLKMLTSFDTDSQTSRAVKFLVD